MDSSIDNTFNSNKTAIDRLYPLIEKYIERSFYYESIELICNDYDIDCDKNFKNTNWENSLIRKILQTHERIKLTDCLLQDISNSFFRQYEYPKLITYLKLTCFDLLGQPDKWVIFSDWINSKKYKDQRDIIISKIETHDKLEFSQTLFLKYQEIFSVKNSFFRFLNEILPFENKKELLDRIEIKKFSEPFSKVNIEVIDKEKEEYLYKIRNNYTHKIYGKAPIHGRESKSRRENWLSREIIYKNNITHCYATSIDFEEKLKCAVYIGIAETIKKYAIKKII